MKVWVIRKLASKPAWDTLVLVYSKNSPRLKTIGSDGRYQRWEYSGNVASTVCIQYARKLGIPIPHRSRAMRETIPCKVTFERIEE